MDIYIEKYPLPFYEENNVNIYMNWKDICLECFEWVFRFHNSVNIKLGRRELSIEEVYDKTILYFEKCDSKLCKI